MEGDSSPLSSLCMVRAEELFPKHVAEKDDDKIKVNLNERKFTFHIYSSNVLQ